MSSGLLMHFLRNQAELWNLVRIQFFLVTEGHRLECNHWLNCFLETLSVEKVNPELVARDEEGKIMSVRYEAVNAMLLNEFLKEHRKNQQQEATITQLKKDLQANAALQQKQIDALTAGLEKVNAQLEASKPAPQVANNP